MIYMIYGEVRKPDNKGRISLSKRLKEDEEVEVWWNKNGVVYKRLRRVKGGRLLIPFKKKDSHPKGVGILVMERGVKRKVIFVFLQWKEVQESLDQLEQAAKQGQEE